MKKARVFLLTALILALAFVFYALRVDSVQAGAFGYGRGPLTVFDMMRGLAEG